MKKILMAILGVALALQLVIPLRTSLQVSAEPESAINVYSTNSGLISPPTVVMEYNDGDDISVFEGTVSSKLVRPATIIVEVDEDFNVLSSGEKVAYDEFRLTYIKSKMIPAVRVESEGAADALIAYLSTRGYDFIDFAVVSTDPALVKKVRDDRPSIRGILDYSKSDISEKTAGSIANEANANKAITVIFDLSQIDAEFVFDVQARFKSVWVQQSVKTKHDVYRALASGAAGIVSDNYAEIYDTYLSIEDSTLSRGFYGIGHRGLPNVAGENTLEGMIAAYEAGATHFEIDTKVCKSGEIVIMHDDGLSTTTNGTGNVYDMTLSEIRQYQVVKNSDGKSVEPCQIPTLEDVFQYFKGKDVVIVVETKNAQLHYPGLFAELVEKYDIADQVVAIGFGLTELGLVRDQAPEIPTANLNGTTKADFLIYMAQVNALNTAMNPAKSGFVTDSWLFRNSLARGYLPYCWTFTTESENEGAVARGCVGITSDCVDTLGGYAKKVLTVSLTINGFDKLSEAFEINVETYAGAQETRQAKVLSYITENETTVKAVLAYEDNSYSRLTEEITINVKEEQTESSLPEESVSERESTRAEGSEDLVQASAAESCKGSVDAVWMIGFVFISGVAIFVRKVKNR